MLVFEYRMTAAGGDWRRVGCEILVLYEISLSIAFFFHLTCHLIAEEYSRLNGMVERLAG